MARAGVHRRAVTRMLRATGLAHVAEEAPLVELLKEMAREMDEGAGGRTRLVYLSALKDLRRVLNSLEGTRKRSVKAPAVVVVESPPVVGDNSLNRLRNDLTRFRESRNIGAKVSDS